MSTISSVHPDAVRDAILATASHPTKRRNLELIHTVCRERNELGNKDYSLKAVGEVVEARGGLKVKALWNPQSADYRKLIDAWQEHVASGSEPSQGSDPGSHRPAADRLCEDGTACGGRDHVVRDSDGPYAECP